MKVPRIDKGSCNTWVRRQAYHEEGAVRDAYPYSNKYARLASFLDWLKCVSQSSHSLGGASGQEMNTLMCCFLGERLVSKMLSASLKTSDLTGAERQL